MNPLIPVILDHLFPNPAIPLNHTNAFSFLVAVVLSAQCTDIKVNEVTPVLFKNGDKPEDLVNLGLENIETILKPLGLYKTKAKNIFALSQILIADYASEVPQDLEELKKLPGVGHKTASCVISQMFNIPAFPVDTHIHRLAEKWNLSNGSSVEQTEKDLKKYFPEETWGRRHLQIIYYARAHCPARGHKIEKCPICFALSLESK